jgi:hypothetical protein
MVILFTAAFARLAEFSRGTPADPVKIHHMFVSAFRANALHLHFVIINIVGKFIRITGFK